MGAFALHFLALTLTGWLQREQYGVVQYLIEENRVLREQLRGKRLRFTDEQRRRLAVRAKALSRQVLLGLNCIVTPDTLPRWHRQLVARKYDGSKARGRGRPSSAADIAKLVVTMANENPTWGYARIRGALFNIGHEIGRNTVARILKDAGLEPSPERKRQPRWNEFLKAHFSEMAATDFFTVEVLTAFGLVRYWVMFVIELRSRRVHIAGIMHSPHAGWTEQIARNLTDPVHGFLRGIRYLIHDRDTLFTARFAAILKAGAIESLKLPARSPNLNAYAERFVRSSRVPRPNCAAR